jgi:type IV secretory pathway VirB4 component
VIGLRTRRERATTTSVPEPGGHLAPGPGSIQVHPRMLEINGVWAASLSVSGYPSEVAPGWLEPMLTYPGRLDVSVHVDPVPNQVAAARLKKQRARLESGRWADAGKGRLADPATEAAAQDATDLAYQIARGQGRLFTVGIYLTVYAGSESDLEREVQAVRSLASSMLMGTVPLTYRALQGWAATLPVGVDPVGTGRVLDTASLAASFPFTSPDLSSPDPTDPGPCGGVLYGANAASSSLVFWDRFAAENHNSVTLARSGAGKSYHTKLEIIRSLYRGVQVHVVDPEDEYARLSDAVGGGHLQLGAHQVRLNPFDLPAHAADGVGDGLTRRALFIHTFVSVLLGQAPDPGQRAALDRAVLAAYAGAGITGDPRTWARPAPLLADLAHALEVEPDPAGPALAARLSPFVAGAFAGLFNGPTTVAPGGHLTVYSLRHVPDELKTVATLLVLDGIWRQVTDTADRRPRLVVVDEAWLLMRDESGARFLNLMAKSARKHWAGLAVITQDTADLLSTDLGQAIVANAATAVLLRQSSQALDAVTRAFALSAGERAYLASADTGCGLLIGGARERAAFQSLASPTEHALITTNPAELLDADL